MGSGCEAAHETVDYLIADAARKSACSKCVCYRPFDGRRFVEALPATVKAIAVLDRTKEPGAVGEPLYQDCRHRDLSKGLANGWGSSNPCRKIVGGRYGLSSKEFTPAMVKARVRQSRSTPTPKNHFTVGINDDVSHTSLPVRSGVLDRAGQRHSRDVLRPGRRRHGGREQEFDQDHRRRDGQLRPGLFRLRFEEVRLHDRLAPALRAGADPLHLSDHPSANFVACHQPLFLERYDMVKPVWCRAARSSSTRPYSKDEVWAQLPTPGAGGAHGEESAAFT